MFRSVSMGESLSRGVDVKVGVLGAASEDKNGRERGFFNAHTQQERNTTPTIVFRGKNGRPTADHSFAGV